ncbi:unnamed protein product [Lampetra fluviatilis]
MDTGKGGGGGRREGDGDDDDELDKTRRGRWCLEAAGLFDVRTQGNSSFEAESTTHAPEHRSRGDPEESARHGGRRPPEMVAFTGGGGQTAAPVRLSAGFVNELLFDTYKHTRLARLHHHEDWGGGMLE